MKRVLMGLMIILPTVASEQAIALCTDVTSLVCLLEEGFQPDPTQKGYHSPACVPKPTGPQQAIIDLAAPKIQKAFGYTLGGKSPTLQDDLCGLKQIFVLTDPNNRHSWGKWENTYYGGSGNTFIALHVSDMNKTVSQRQNDNTAALGIGAGVATHSETLARGDDPQALGLLYIMAHEMAHIAWRKTTNRFPANCSQDTFLNYSWANPGDANTRRWTEYLADLADFGGAVRKGHVKDPKNADVARLKDIYSHGVIDGLAAQNPEEDFVETYSIKAVSNGSPTSKFNIKFGDGSSKQVNSARGHAHLQAKYGTCVSPFLK